MPVLLWFFLVFSLQFPHNSQAKSQDQSLVQKKKNLRKLQKKLSRVARILNSEEVGSKRYRVATDKLENLYTVTSVKNFEILSRIYYSKKDRAQAQKVLENMILIHPNKSEGYHLLGMHHKKTLDRYKEFPCSLSGAQEKKKQEHLVAAIENFRMSLSKDIKNEASYVELYPLLKEANKLDFSEEDTTASDTKKKDSKEASPEPEEANNYSDFLDIAKNAVTYFNKPKYQSWLCESYYENKFFSKAKEACLQASSKQSFNPNNEFYYYLLVGAEKKNSLVYASKQFKRIGRKFKDSDSLQKKIGEFFMETNPKLAMSFFKKSLAVNPDQADLQYQVAKFLYKSEKKEESLAYFKQACMLDYSYAGDFRQARKTLHGPDKKLRNLFEQGFAECYENFKKRQAECKKQNLSDEI